VLSFFYRSSGNGNHFSLQEIGIEHLHLASHLFATSCSGTILHGIYKVHLIIVKLVPFSLNRAIKGGACSCDGIHLCTLEKKRV